MHWILFYDWGLIYDKRLTFPTCAGKGEANIFRISP